MVTAGPCVLCTARLVMTPMSRKDSADLYDGVVSHDAVMRWLATGRAGSLADASRGRPIDGQ